MNNQELIVCENCKHYSHLDKDCAFRLKPTECNKFKEERKMSEDLLYMDIKPIFKKKNKYVPKARDVLYDGLKKLESKRNNLKEQIFEKYPESLYGLKPYNIYERKSKELDEEIKIANDYIKAFEQIICNIEKGRKFR